MQTDQARISPIPQEAVFTRDDTLIVKGAGVLLMLANHLFSYPYRIAPGNTYLSLFSLRGSPVEYLVGVFGFICVPIFMVLSGYGTYLSFRKMPAKQLPLLTGKKLLRVYKSVWGVFAVFIPLGILLGAPNIVLTPGAFLLNFFGLELTYNEEWWFLTAFLVLTVLAPLFVLWLRSRYSTLWVDVILALALAMVVPAVLKWCYAQESLSWLTQNFVYRMFNTAFTYLPEFFAGCLLAKYNVFARVRMLVKRRWVLCVGSVLWMGFAFWVMPRHDTLLGFLSTPLVILACATLLRDIPVVNKIMAQIGKKSTGIWLIHSFFCYYYFQNFIYRPRYSPLVFGLLLAVSFASAWAIDLLWNTVGRVYLHVKGWL